MDALLRDAIAGSREARDRLVEAFAPELRRYIERRMGAGLQRQFSAADLCQDTFLQVFESIHLLSPDAAIDDFRGLLFRHAQWQLAGRARRNLRFIGESGAPAVASLRDEAASVGGAGPGNEELANLRALASRIDPKYGAVILRRLEGKPFAAIGSELGEKEATVRKRFQRATELLRRLSMARAPAGPPPR